jgi:hypothetical protein
MYLITEAIDRFCGLTTPQERIRSAQNQAKKEIPFASLKQINAGVLNVEYAEDGTTMVPAAILLHGWGGATIFTASRSSAGLRRSGRRSGQ